MIDRKLLKEHSYTGNGFKPLVIFKSWRVAVLNYKEDLKPRKIRAVERHPQTDEVFVLMHGKATLFLGEGKTEVKRLYSRVMEPGIIYNIKPQTWHTVVMSRDASILIVENADTGKGNSEFCELSPEQRQFILSNI
jgi:ureidoglycolate hydrolase